jgi:alpha-tubulin suppressor-like RCC1 family protein
MQAISMNNGADSSALGSRGWVLARALVTVAVIGITGCGGSDDPVPPSPPPAPAPLPTPGYAAIGPQGGTVRGEAGAEVRIPPDALFDTRTIRIARDATDMPPLPPGTAPISDVWTLTPHDIASRVPMTVRIPFDASRLRAGERPGVLKGSTDGQWQLIEEVTVEGDTVQVQVRSFSFLLVRPLPPGTLIARPGVPPNSTQPIFTVSVENAGFQTVPVTNFAAEMRQQQLPNEPANVRYSLRVPAASAVNDVCTFGASRYPIYAYRHTIPVAIYRLPGDGAGVNRLSAYFRGASRTPLIVNPAGTTEEAQYSVLPDRDYVVNQTVNALDYQWRAESGNPFPYTYDWANSLPGELPANATVDSWGVMVKLVISCASGLPAFASTAPPVVIARGFPNDLLFFNGPPTLNAAFPGQQANGQINVTIDPTQQSSGYQWQIRRPGASTWTDVPRIISATQPPGVSVWSADQAISFVPQASDNGTELRVQACVQPAGSGLGGSLLRTCYMSPVGRVTVSNQFPTPRIVIQPGPAAFRVNDTFYLRAEYEAFPLPQTGTSIVWQTRADASQAWSALPVPVNLNGNPWPQTPISTVFRAADLRNDRGVTEVSRAFAQPVTVADRGQQYRLILSLNNTTLTSNVVTIAVDSGVAPPRFTVQPSDVQAQAGSAALLSAAVEGGAPLSYRWLFNGQAILGANAPTLSLPTVNSGNAGQYQLEVSNADATIRSTAARLTVTVAPPPVVTAPSINTQPAALSVVAGNTATFTVTVNGTAPYTYQWRRNGSSIAGATSQVLTLLNVGTADAGDYSVVVSNAIGSATSNNAALTVTTTTTPPPVVAPSIGTQPVGLSVNRGQTATFAVAASGSGPLAYQWQRNGSNVPGATGPVLTLTNVQDGDAGNYIVTVSNSAGSATSNAAGLIVAPPPGTPVITAQPGNANAVAGNTATFNATVTGNPTPQCQWTRNGVAIAGATTCASYTTPTLNTADNGTFYNLVAYNTAGPVFGNGAVLTVQPLAAPSITSQPQSLTLTEGQNASFSVAATSNGPLTFQWQRGGTSVAGATDNVYALGASSIGDNGAQFSVRVCTGPQANNLCTVSSVATLTINVAVPANALTATQIVAGQEWSLVLRPDRTVWAWGARHRIDGTVQMSNLLVANQALRPVRMYPAVLTDVRAISGWANSYWALKGEPGTTGSRVLHWGRADSGSDGRGGDGNGSLGSSIAPRDNEAAPVEVLERVNDVPQPVDRVCAIAGGGAQLAMIRAINSAGATTDCNAGSAKTVWFVGSLRSLGFESTGVAFAMPGLPVDSPPSVIFTGQTTSGSPGLAIALEDGRLYGLGANPYGGYGVPSGGGGAVGGLGGPLLLPASWGSARSLGMSFYYSLFVVRADGSVVTSGYDLNGELGLGSVIGGSTLGPVAVKAETCDSLPCADNLTGVTALASGNGTATLALKNGQILGWGSRGSGLLGPVASGGQPFPRPVVSPGVSGFTALSVSNLHAVVIGPGNVVYAWGSGLRGALGDGIDGSSRTAPGMVTTGP